MKTQCSKDPVFHSQQLHVNNNSILVSMLTNHKPVTLIVIYEVYIQFPVIHKKYQTYYIAQYAWNGIRDRQNAVCLGYSRKFLMRLSIMCCIEHGARFECKALYRHYDTYHTIPHQLARQGIHHLLSSTRGKKSKFIN